MSILRAKIEKLSFRIILIIRVNTGAILPLDVVWSTLFAISSAIKWLGVLASFKDC
jgi:hypothetical protein